MRPGKVGKFNEGKRIRNCGSRPKASSRRGFSRRSGEPCAVNTCAKEVTVNRVEEQGYHDKPHRFKLINRLRRLCFWNASLRWKMISTRNWLCNRLVVEG
jgi:hypothetical protein